MVSNQQKESTMTIQEMKESSIKIQEILRDPATSYWLRDALTALLERDPVDALHDTEILQKVFVDLLDSHRFPE
jgi:hypothetical protein